jgi:ABC-type antimicrobial peptide transport system permease subunit
VLITFLLSVYRGVSDGTLEYIRENKCTLWVLQEGTTNIVRGSSWLPAERMAPLRQLALVGSASPILLALCVVRHGDVEGTVYLVGHDPDSPLGGPPRLTAGRAVRQSNEIVLDRCFAAKYDLGVGDTVAINQTRLVVVGLSDGTNAFVVQYAFVTLATAQQLTGGLPMVSAYLLSLKEPRLADSVAAQILNIVAGVSVYSYERFVSNNRTEMQAGFLPFIVSVCVMTVGVLMIILGLLLSLLVVEQRSDYAVMKTIGAPALFLPALVLRVSGLVAGMGIAAGLLLYFPVAAVVRQLAPELHTVTTTVELARIAAGVATACLVSAILPLRKLSTIYPTEAFA